MRVQVSAIAVGLFLQQGYDATTVEDICAAADISRSTFFRYFPTKEDALFGLAGDTGARLVTALAARPAEETPWTALRRALDPRLEEIAAGGVHARRLVRLIQDTPGLAARHREKDAEWHQMLRPEVARRLGASPAVTCDPRADALIAAALGCLDAALMAWTASDEPPELPELLDCAMAAVG
ncbi:TetR family transcriptional regulator [Actinoplanes awajinensis subsp. mycoplanecinus]|uniref:TetR family transcriptional regulator n=2 Tax=Actinoplanes awajinensis TaxID=135946 RepID=A0A101JMR2_9ACTN|nr:TetR family transcriptional regulator [Actinoplanes awajinensis subsp. mycoplanecinus]